MSQDIGDAPPVMIGGVEGPSRDHGSAAREAPGGRGDRRLRGVQGVGLQAARPLRRRGRGRVRTPIQAATVLTHCNSAAGRGPDPGPAQDPDGAGPRCWPAHPRLALGAGGPCGLDRGDLAGPDPARRLRRDRIDDSGVVTIRYHGKLHTSASDEPTTEPTSCYSSRTCTSASSPPTPANSCATSSWTPPGTTSHRTGPNARLTEPVGSLSLRCLETSHRCPRQDSNLRHLYRRPVLHIAPRLPEHAPVKDSVPAPSPSCPR